VLRVQDNTGMGGSGLFWLYADHLGSTTLTTNIDGDGGTQLSTLSYTAWGETRASSGTTPTSIRYTGQREAETGLYFYQARWYDPALGRFAQADTIIPGQDAQAFDRYAYSNNNPINYKDPDGHAAKSTSNAIGPIGWFVVFVVAAVVVITTAVVYEASLYHFASTPSTDCSLAQCFKENKRRVFSENEKISAKEFDELLEVTAQDIDKPFRTPYDPGRAEYDTPFYDGGVKGNNKNVCIEGMGCYPQSGVNYVAQGMYSARTGESLEKALAKTVRWELDVNRKQEPSPEKLFWTEYGYKYYQKHKNKEQE
jgi:RHS repeat-associated protein